MLPRISVGVLVLVAILNSAGASNAATLSPKAANLTMADLPSGFTQESNELMQNPAAAKQAKRSMKEFNAEGRLLTSYESFSRNSIVGLVAIEGEVVLYKNASDARLDYQRALSRIQKDAAPRKFKPMSFERIGTASSAVTWSGKSGAFPITVDIVEFYKGRFAVQVGIIGITNTFDEGVLTTLARKVEKRVEAQQ